MRAKSSKQRCPALCVKKRSSAHDFMPSFDLALTFSIKTLIPYAMMIIK